MDTLTMGEDDGVAVGEGVAVLRERGASPTT